MSFIGIIAAMHIHAASASAMREIFPGVRADLKRHVVEFDATTSPMLVKDDRAPHFFLEVVCCTPDTREHETLLVTTVKPSHIHAALLAIGLEPGTPGAFKFENDRIVPVQPTGPALQLEVVFRDATGARVTADPLEWIVNVKDGGGFLAAESKLTKAPTFVFAGSKLMKRKDPASGQEREVYDADGSGTVIGLTTFGSEVVGWGRVISPESQYQEPEWIADFSKVPAASTPVVVRLRQRN